MNTTGSVLTPALPTEEFRRRRWMSGKRTSSACANARVPPFEETRDDKAYFNQ